MVDSPKKKSSAVRSLKFIPVVVVMAGGAWWIAHAQSTPDAAKSQRRATTVAVGVAPVEKKDVPLQLSALGTVSSTYTVTVRSRVDGQLEKVHFVEGQEVKEGQLLAELDPRPYQATLTQTQGQLLRDQALLRNAELDLARYRQLLEQNSIAQQQVDTQDALVHQYQGTVKLDQGAVDNAKLQLSYSRIAAPIAGRLGLRQVDPGNMVHASDTNGVVVITQVQPINVLFSVPETSLGQVLQARANNEVLQVEAWDRDNKTKLAEGSLLAIDNQLNTSSGTVSLKARFNNKDQRLFPNQFVNVRLHLGEQKGAVTVPAAAIQTGKPGNYVYLANEDQTVSIAQVTPGVTAGGDVVITAGVRPGQRVVTDGLDKLRDGAHIQIIDRDSQAKGQAEGEGKAWRRKQGGSPRPDGAGAQSAPRGSDASSRREISAKTE